jgi:hypothetical protein
MIDTLPRIDVFIEDDRGDGDCGCCLSHEFFPTLDIECLTLKNKGSTLDPWAILFL